jgi:hypothetical protein
MRRNAVVSRLRRTRTSSEKDKSPWPRSRFVCRLAGLIIGIAGVSPSHFLAVRRVLDPGAFDRHGQGDQERSVDNAQRCKAVLAFSIVPGVLILDDDLGFVTAAQAVIGRPLTPLSVAGVARRTTKRAYRRAYYYGGAAVAAGAAAGAYYYGGGYPHQYGGYAYPHQYGGYYRY